MALSHIKLNCFLVPTLPEAAKTSRAPRQKRAKLHNAWDYANKAGSPSASPLRTRDGVCYPVTHVLPMVTFLNHVETLRTGQHAPSGWEMNGIMGQVSFQVQTNYRR
jgi:hypothetical protein